MLGIGVMHIFALNALWQDVRCGGGPSFLRSIAISLGVVSAIALRTRRPSPISANRPWRALAARGMADRFATAGSALFLVLADISWYRRTGGSRAVSRG